MRNGLVDAGRLVAALGIVWFHTQAPGARIGYVALPFFLTLLALGSGADWRRRASRLLRPFILWSVIYALVRVVLSLRAGEGALSWWRPEMLLMGTWVHLWFLPYAFLIAVVLAPVRAPAIRLALPVLAAALVAWTGRPDHAPWAQWAFGLVPVTVGLAHAAAGWPAFLSLAAAVAILAVFVPSPDTAVIAAGSALGLAAMTIRLPASRLSAWCAEAAMEVYLAHPLLILAGMHAGLRGLPLALFSLVATTAFAALLILLRRRLAGRRGAGAAGSRG